MSNTVQNWRSYAKFPNHSKSGIANGHSLSFLPFYPRSQQITRHKMADDEQFSLCWNNFNTNLSAGFHESLVRGDLVDVTLAAEGQLVKAHRLILSVCSPYFRKMFTQMPANQHAFSKYCFSLSFLFFVCLRQQIGWWELAGEIDFPCSLCVQPRKIDSAAAPSAVMRIGFAFCESGANWNWLKKSNFKPIDGISENDSNSIDLQCSFPLVLFSSVFLKDVSHSALKDLIQFMYCGEVNVKQDALPAFISTAEALQIKGLTETVSLFHNANITCEMGPIRKCKQRFSYCSYQKHCYLLIATTIHEMRWNASFSVVITNKLI